MTSSASHPSEEMYCPGCENTFYGVEFCPNDGAKLVRFVTQPDRLIGRTFDGRYTVVEKLGEGGMGSVYRSRQHSFGREVAIKVVNPGLVTDPMIIKRFLREAKLSSRLSHPNAVAVLDFGQTDDGIFYLVMELVQGRTLHDAMAQTPQFTPERVVRVGTQICDALECAHDLGIVHRDLKPSNVMLLSTGRDLVKVLDFGLAKSLAVDDRSTTMTGTRGGLMGTPAFVAPELALGRPCDHRADLYSLGCILYLIGSGWPPFSAENGAELVSKHAYEEPAPMPNAPPALAAVVMRLLSKNPEDRYPSAAATRQALEEALALPHAAAPVALPPQHSASWQRDRPATVLSEESVMAVMPRAIDDDPLTADDVTSVSVRAESPTRLVHQPRPLRLLPILLTLGVLAGLGGAGYYWVAQREASVRDPSPAQAQPATPAAPATPPTVPAVVPTAVEPTAVPAPAAPAAGLEGAPAQPFPATSEAPVVTPPAAPEVAAPAPEVVEPAPADSQAAAADKPSRSRSSRRNRRRAEPAATGEAPPAAAVPSQDEPAPDAEPAGAAPAPSSEPVAKEEAPKEPKEAPAAPAPAPKKEAAEPEKAAPPAESPPGS